jgi:hypothetical protein
METKPAASSGAEASAVGRAASPAQAPRRKRNAPDADVNVRYFLPKDGSSSGRPELGRELPTEGDALIAALKGNQHFFAVTTWNAVAEVNGGNPVIVKQALPRT